jgi:DinB superfamily
MPPSTPYTPDLGDREPLAAMQQTIERIRSLSEGWSSPDFDRSYAPGKWSARQILVHLTQTELVFGNRVRMALATPNYVAQPMDQDRWMIAEADAASGTVARDALVAMNAMNCALFSALTPAQRETAFSHPEYGALTVDWVIHQMAGHLVHHVKQLEAIGAAKR